MVDNLTDDAKACLRAVFPQTFTYRVRHAPCMLLDNVNPAGMMANGSDATWEGMGLSQTCTEAVQRMERDDLRDRSIPIMLPEAPLIEYFSVDAITASPADSPVRKWAASCGVKEVDGVPWFPIATSAPRKRTTAKRRDVTVVVRSPGGDLAFCITVHKSQGSTQRRIIIDLGKHAGLTMAMVYVLLSRVRSWDDIRILQNYAANPSSLAHLLLLRNDRDSTLVRWLAAFDDDALLHGAAGARFDLERLQRHDATLGSRPNARRASKARTGANAFSPDSWLLVPILRVAWGYTNLSRVNTTRVAERAAEAVQAGAWAALTTAYRTHTSKLRARPVRGGKGLYESCHHFTVAQVQLLFYGTQDGKLLDDSILALIRTILDKGKPAA